MGRVEIGSTETHEMTFGVGTMAQDMLGNAPGIERPERIGIRDVNARVQDHVKAGVFF